MAAFGRRLREAHPPPPRSSMIEGVQIRSWWCRSSGFLIMFGSPDVKAASPSASWWHGRVCMPERWLRMVDCMVGSPKSITVVVLGALVGGVVIEGSSGRGSWRSCRHRWQPNQHDLESSVHRGGSGGMSSLDKVCVMG